MTNLDLKPILGIKNQTFTNVELDDKWRALLIYVSGDIWYDVKLTTLGTITEKKVLKTIVNISKVEAKSTRTDEYIEDAHLLSQIKTQIEQHTKDINIKPQNPR